MKKSTKLLSIAALSMSLLMGCNKSVIELPQNSITISGKVTCPIDASQGFEGAKVELIRNSKVVLSTTTNAKGEYSFSNLEGGYDYTLSLSKDSEKLKLNTLDLLLLSKKLIGSDVMLNSFQALAADTDLSGTIDSKDVEDVRKEVLGIADIDTWRFATTDYEFPSASNPNGKGSVNGKALPTLVGSISNVDFVALQIFDIEFKEVCK